MRWFTRAKASRFPSDMLRRMDLLGRYQLGSHASGIDGEEIWPHCIAPFAQVSNADRDGFLRDLRAVAAEDQGGFATLGVACLVWELYGGEALTVPAALPLIDAGIDFKLARGLPTASLTGYEMKRLIQRDADAH